MTAFLQLKIAFGAGLGYLFFKYKNQLNLNLQLYSQYRAVNENQTNLFKNQLKLKINAVNENEKIIKAVI